MRIGALLCLLFASNAAASAFWKRLLPAGARPPRRLFKRSGLRTCKPRGAQTVLGGSNQNLPLNPDAAPSGFQTDPGFPTDGTGTPNQPAAGGTSTSEGASAQGTTLPVPASTGSKRGISYTDLRMVSPFGSSVSWAYNWAATSAALPSGVDFIPQLHGADTKGWLQVAGAAKFLMHVNEPDGTGWGQANMSAKDAADSWRANMEPFAKSAKLVSPAITNGPAGVPWLQEFMTECSGCTVNYINLHWYSEPGSGDPKSCYFGKYLSTTASLFKLPVWVTEFAATGTDEAELSTFYQTVIPWMEAQPYIARYALFGAFNNMADNFTLPPIASDNKTLTKIGSAYALTGPDAAKAAAYSKLCGL